jgi:hypothetical protein
LAKNKTMNNETGFSQTMNDAITASFIVCYPSGCDLCYHRVGIIADSDARSAIYLLLPILGGDQWLATVLCTTVRWSKPARPRGRKTGKKR